MVETGRRFCSSNSLLTDIQRKGAEAGSWGLQVLQQQSGLPLPSGKRLACSRLAAAAGTKARARGYARLKAKAAARAKQAAAKAATEAAPPASQKVKYSLVANSPNTLYAKKAAAVGPLRPGMWAGFCISFFF